MITELYFKFLKYSDYLLKYKMRKYLDYITQYIEDFINNEELGAF